MALPLAASGRVRSVNARKHGVTVSRFRARAKWRTAAGACTWSRWAGRSIGSRRAERPPSRGSEGRIASSPPMWRCPSSLEAADGRARTVHVEGAAEAHQPVRLMRGALEALEPGLDAPQRSEQIVASVVICTRGADGSGVHGPFLSFDSVRTRLWHRIRMTPSADRLAYL